MLIMMAVSGLLLAVGAIVTWHLWSRRSQPAVRTFLRRAWLAITLGILAVVGLTLTSTGVFVWYAYLKLGHTIQQSLNLPPSLASGIAALAALPVVMFLLFTFSFKAWKRRVGIAGVMLTVAALGFARYANKELVFQEGGGSSDIGYTITVRDNRVRLCNTPGMIDQTSGLPCLSMRPEVLEYFHEASAGKREVPLWLEDPKEFFRLVDGKPKVWVCRASSGSYRFAAIPLFDPVSGQDCKPVTPGFVQNYHAEQAQKAELARQEEERRLVEAQRLEEQREAEEQQRLAEAHQAEVQRQIEERQRLVEERAMAEHRLQEERQRQAKELTRQRFREKKLAEEEDTRWRCSGHGLCPQPETDPEVIRRIGESLNRLVAR